MPPPPPPPSLAQLNRVRCQPPLLPRCCLVAASSRCPLTPRVRTLAAGRCGGRAGRRPRRCPRVLRPACRPAGSGACDAPAAARGTVQPRRLQPCARPPRRGAAGARLCAMRSCACAEAPQHRNGALAHFNMLAAPRCCRHRPQDAQQCMSLLCAAAARAGLVPASRHPFWAKACRRLGDALLGLQQHAQVCCRGTALQPTHAACRMPHATSVHEPCVASGWRLKP